MTASHTPGPWRVTGGQGTQVVTRTNGRHIANVGEFHPAGCEERANARLIASAPVLLAKLHDLAGECSECGGTGLSGLQPCPDCADILAVIRLATGERT